MRDSLDTNRLLDQATAVFERTIPVISDEPLRCGVDLGTASIILTVLNSAGEPVACEMQPCQVARDGLVVDYIGAIQITRKLADRLEQRLGRRIVNAAIAIPPGTNQANSGTHRHIVEAAGMEVTAVLDEPTAANAVLNVQNGAVVDIGGGTTGLAVFRNGEVIYVADEATGGIHMSLVLMGRYKIDFDAAEAFKTDVAKHKEVRSAVLPVVEKMATIVQRHIEPFHVEEVWIVGGTCALTGIEEEFTRVLDIGTRKPTCPMMVTPMGIALNCVPG